MKVAIIIAPKKDKMATSEMLQEPPEGGEPGNTLGEEGGDEGHICCVPLENIREDNIEPQEGDEVEFNVKGIVERVEDGKAYVKPEEVNGQPVQPGNTQSVGPEKQTNDEEDIDKQAGPMLAQRDKEMGYA